MADDPWIPIQDQVYEEGQGAPRYVDWEPDDEEAGWMVAPDYEGHLLVASPDFWSVSYNGGGDRPYDVRDGEASNLEEAKRVARAVADWNVEYGVDRWDDDDEDYSELDRIIEEAKHE